MRIFSIISSLLLTCIWIFLLIVKGISWEAVGGILFFGLGSLVLIFEKRLNQWTEKKKQKRTESANCQIKETCFYFPKGYYFKYGFLKNRKELPFERITEIRTNTYPITAILDTNEVIFLKGLKKKDVKPLQAEKDLKLLSPQDNWSLICDTFLDTEFEEEERLHTFALLAEKGLGEKEVSQIRKRLKTRMLLRTFISWEWVYYGQYDVLKELWPLTVKKYQWTMDIALRNSVDISET